MYIFLLLMSQCEIMVILFVGYY